eukprot:CAMPEP_0179433262 /NCGR_PEP_ID=MMETSP0799-20121207/17700_1 /TAXON_ID=46947 /ORGANISM="Geminigera cryophila, Strain CCMP2564" /LENGTH=74 /DNA_ID=CAMNT_0021211113 /DNA_START=55 /DNA_END=279 /DNA_ORIENTATION=+
MSTAMGVESLSFMAKSGAVFFGIGYGAIRTGFLQRKERKIEAKETALAHKKAGIAAKKAAKAAAEGKSEESFFS